MDRKVSQKISVWCALAILCCLSWIATPSDAQTRVELVTVSAPPMPRAAQDSGSLWSGIASGLSNLANRPQSMARAPKACSKAGNSACNTRFNTSGSNPFFKQNYGFSHSDGTRKTTVAVTHGWKNFLGLPAGVRVLASGLRGVPFEAVLLFFGSIIIAMARLSSNKNR